VPVQLSTPLLDRYCSKKNYIHQNPVEEGLVFRAEDYVYSNAIDYARGKRMLELFVIS